MYTISRRVNADRHYGGVAQLGERLHGMQEVRGSIPLVSTTKMKSRKPYLIGFAGFLCLLGGRNRSTFRGTWVQNGRNKNFFDHFKG